MPNEKEYFNFEDKTVDFPFYSNGKFFQDKKSYVLIASLLLFVFLIFGPVKFYDYQEQAILSLVMLIPLLYYGEGRLCTLFRKPVMKDLRTVIFSCVAYFPYIFIVISIGVLFESILGINIVSTISNTAGNLDLVFLIFEFIQIIGEELFRVILFLVVLTICFKYSGNRKTSIIIGTIIALAVFGLMHINSYPNILYCFVVMGIGNFFELYPYLKSKNVLLSIIVHFILNIIITVIRLNL